MATQQQQLIVPKYIEAVYYCPLTFEIEDIEQKLNIKWSNVSDFCIKYCEMTIETKDGRQLTYYGKDGGDINMENCKYPNMMKILDDSFNVIEEKRGEL